MHVPPVPQTEARLNFLNSTAHNFLYSHVIHTLVGIVFYSYVSLTLPDVFPTMSSG